MDKYLDNSVNGCQLLDNSTIDVLEKSTIENTKNKVQDYIHKIFKEIPS